MQAFNKLSSRTVVLPATDVDTDQIIPARFLTTTTREGLGSKLFFDWRFNADGTENPQFVLNDATADGCEILIAGRNFGCGSSREHAPWALLDYGIRAVVSTEIADIFRSNSLKNGLLPIVVDETSHALLLANPGSEVTIDVSASTISLPDGSEVSYPIDEFARHCLLEGVDQLGFLQQHSAEIENFEETRSWTP
ncbi:MAG: 3-isopropylmalate dehydratase small subunit [Gammaproteobacteria bacterium]|nr:MAG: 3-isopropylmalate dehydratase small subunit [Gammaproteobacteria bacterium]